MRLGEAGGIFAVLEGEGEGDLKNTFLIPLLGINKYHKSFLFFFLCFVAEWEWERELMWRSWNCLFWFLMEKRGEWWGVFIDWERERERATEGDVECWEKKKSEEVGSGSGGDCVKRNGWHHPVTVSNSVYTVYVWLLPIVMDYTRLLPCFGRLFSPSCCVSFLFLHGVITGIWQNDWDHSCPDTRYISYYIKKKIYIVSEDYKCS